MREAHGAERIKEAFRRAEEKGNRALIPFITAGDPDLETTVAITLGLVAGGADVVEWGVPYSDPLADGVTVQRASQRALQGGTTARRVMAAARDLREQGCAVPLVLLVYANILWRHGPETFVREAANCGIDGLIIPDLPVEEGSHVATLCRKVGLARIPLVAPTSPPARIARVVAQGDGFVYCVSVTGVTGARERMWEGLPDFLARIRPHTSLPLAVGFGISSPAQAGQVARYADGVIVGSALIQYLEEVPPAGRPGRAQEFMAAMKSALVPSNRDSRALR